MMTFAKSVAKKVLPGPVIDWLRGPRPVDIVWVPGPLTYNQDGLATRHNCDFIHEPRFAEAYRLGRDTGSWFGNEVHWRAYVVCWAAYKGKDLEGDFVECGVNRGGYARAIIHYLGFEKLPKKFYLLDTFHGLVDESLSEEERRIRGGASVYTECYEAVKKTFGPFPNVEIIRGAVPGTLSQVRSEKVAFLSIDMNCAAPEIAAAEFFWDKLVPGAVMMLDDYGWSGHITQKHAFDEFAAKRGLLVLPMPTGQGLIIKP